MLISFNTDFGNLNTNVGYGVGSYNIIRSLQKLGHSVPFSYQDAPVEIFFCQPEYWEFSGEGYGKNQYRIGYVPWESTEIPEMWWPGLERVEEVWTTSQWCKKIYEQAGVPGPVHVYEHGIDDVWTPKHRKRRDKLRFLHVGEPASRKGGQDTLNAFLDVFGDSENVELVMKAQHYNHARAFKDGMIYPLDRVKNVKIITDDVTETEMLAHYHRSHVLLYPSYGEGFGFIPLQALATGMPVICTEEWAPYSHHFQGMGLKSEYIDSPWPAMHPGQVVKPDQEELRQKMLYAYENFELLSDKFYDNAPAVHEEYNWVNKTEVAFRHIVEKFG